MKHRSLFFSSWLLLQGLSLGWGLATEAVAQDIGPLEQFSEAGTPDVVTDEGTGDSRTTEEQSSQPYEPLRPTTICPVEPENLTGLMIHDLPNYTNRVLQRTIAVLPWTEADEQKEREGAFVRQPYRPSHVLIAGQVSLTPLDLDDYTYTTESAAGGPLTQVFFTTLSRQYSSLRFNEVQEYHWLFLTLSTDGWRLAFMFSSIDDAQSTRAPLPPSESSQSSVGQAVQLWLRDCRAGAIDAN